MSRDIDTWLDKFEKGWRDKDIDSVLELFTEDVEYFETPFEELENKKALRDEWQTIKDQRDIRIKTEVFSREDDKFTVKWDLSYSKNGEENNLKGIYLVRLNSDNKCYEFWQYFVQN